MSEADHDDIAPDDVAEHENCGGSVDSPGPDTAADENTVSDDMARLWMENNTLSVAEKWQVFVSEVVAAYNAEMGGSVENVEQLKVIMESGTISDQLRLIYRVIFPLVKEKNPELARHLDRVADMAYYLASTYTPDPKDDDFLATVDGAAMMHDIGKLFLSFELLSKRGLTSEEGAILDSHVWSGYYLADILGLPEKIKKPVLLHHKIQNGKHNPNEIPDGAILGIEEQIVSLADLFISYFEKRPYRDFVPTTTAQKKDILLRKLEGFKSNGAKGKFDEQVLRMCVLNIDFIVYRIETLLAEQDNS